jgi:hypothetical protein
MVSKKGDTMHGVVACSDDIFLLEYTTPMPKKIKAECQFLFDQMRQTRR